MVNHTNEAVIPMTLSIPYLNARLALTFPSIGQLANFHMDSTRAHQKKGISK